MCALGWGLGVAQGGGGARGARVRTGWAGPLSPPQSAGVLGGVCPPKAGGEEMGDGVGGREGAGLRGRGRRAIVHRPYW